MIPAPGTPDARTRPARCTGPAPPAAKISSGGPPTAARTGGVFACMLDGRESREDSGRAATPAARTRTRPAIHRAIASRRDNHQRRPPRTRQIQDTAQRHGACRARTGGVFACCPLSLLGGGRGQGARTTRGVRELLARSPARQRAAAKPGARPATKTPSAVKIPLSGPATAGGARAASWFACCMGGSRARA
ncbi:hypothetical protein B0H17DRAFT_533968 [Mycena rosella]|uniref:Uncharacterized protein n=1 Tax=Mycena rosella TaxID=1033263 RepID=A0AAD7GFR0_MYCRO|nr:hypothetical protein B0H17DRAFT_533968 [Mycena rosella]